MKISQKIDRLTNSIANVKTNESFKTEVIPVKKSEIKKKDWAFDWHKEIASPDRQVYKLVTLENPKIIHGLISLGDSGDVMIMHLIENASFNKGRDKIYEGVAGNLVAYACKLSLEKGYDGYLIFVAKTKLIEHYKSKLGATPFGRGNQMVIETQASLSLIKQYFPDENN